MVCPQIKDQKGLNCFMDQVRRASRISPLVLLQAPFLVCRSLGSIDLPRQCVVILEPNQLRSYEYSALLGVKPRSYMSTTPVSDFKPWFGTPWYRLKFRRSPKVVSRVVREQKMYKTYQSLGS